MRAAGGSSTSSTSPATPTWIIPPSGSAIITRVLESHGYKVGFIAQPDWNDPESVAVFGEPRLGFLVSAGNMDSMVNHYTVNKKHRHDDAYTPGGKGGAASQPRGRGLFEPHSPHLQGNAHHFGRHRGESAPARPLRLLVRFPQALHLARFRGRPHLLRHGGALYRRDRRCPCRGPFRERPHLHRRHGVPHALARARGRLRDAAQLGGGFGRTSAPSRRASPPSTARAIR